MNTWLAIDPGVDTGWAVVDSAGALLACGLGEDFDRGQRYKPRGAIIERPQVYRASKSKGDPNDLITLAIRVGRYQERLESHGVPVSLVLPTTWKGQIPKEIHHARVADALTIADRETLAQCTDKLAKSKAHNVWDAVALAKWAWQARRFAISQIVR